MEIEFGAPGTIMPPADKAVDNALRAERDGYDSIWWPSHLMGWHPESVWTEDITPLAKHQPNPHTYFDKLKDAVLGRSPYTPGGPPIWIAAHMPRMLGITGRKGDGWLPTKMLPEEYGEALKTIRKASVDAGRAEDAVVPGMLAYVIVG